MMENIMLGSLYFDGVPQKVGAEYSFEAMSLGDTVPGKEILWLKLKSGAMIADKCVCVNVSWDQLNENHLVFGTLAQINGITYLCRCLKVGAEDGVPNEWDAALDEVGGNNRVWHWELQYFWGQETPRGWAASRAVRGYFLARTWNYYAASDRGVSVGFRPVLEPLTPAPLDYGSMVGTEITPMGPDYKFVSGRLVAFTDYDLVLEAFSPLPDACKWAVPAGKQIIVDRASVSWLKKN